jgi:site-specific recombinase XerD
VQEFLGHASITTTQRYTHVSLVQLRNDLEVFHPNRNVFG